VVERTVKFEGDNAIVWGCMSWDGVVYATRVEGKMNGALYVSIMKDKH
jgi:hypothetical protein